MNIAYTARGFNLTNQIQKYTETKLRKIVNLDELLEVNLTLEHARHRYKAELLVHNRNARFNAIEETSDVFKSINAVIEKIQKQLKRHKGKFIARKRQTAPRVTKLAENMAAIERVKEPRLIRARKQDIKPMSQDEALMQLDSGNEAFLIFRNINSDKINLMYRRKDGNIGLIDPDI
ncbi:MAG TPA: ribosome-associated translation inhibitor RaiA [Acidobacteriota bacterium]|nr:ribosome-associated translation inhibitor RaiA [Acidobacteriota bacterium]